MYVFEVDFHLENLKVPNYQIINFNEKFYDDIPNVKSCFTLADLYL